LCEDVKGPRGTDRVTTSLTAGSGPEPDLRFRSVVGFQSALSDGLLTIAMAADYDDAVPLQCILVTER